MKEQQIEQAVKAALATGNWILRRSHAGLSYDGFKWSPIGEWRNELPEGLQVGGSLDLRGTQITALPEGLQVGGSLDLGGMQITALPEGFEIAKVIR